MSSFKPFCAALAVMLCTQVPMQAMAADCATHGMMRHMMKKMDKGLLKNPAVMAYLKANNDMMYGMDIIYTGNADIDFTNGMIPHHQGAVDMANVQLQYGKDEELKALSRRIVWTQMEEIRFMKQWLAGRTSKWRADNVNELDSVKAYKATMHKMHAGMGITFTGDADRDFVNGMIPHHQGAIDMAWILKEEGMDPKLRELASDIVRSQGQEIRMMQAWLEKNPAPAVKAPEKAKKKTRKKAAAPVAPTAAHDGHKH